MADEAGGARKLTPRGWGRYQVPVNILIIGNALAAAYWLLNREEKPRSVQHKHDHEKKPATHHEEDLKPASVVEAPAPAPVVAPASPGPAAVQAEPVKNETLPSPKVVQVSKSEQLELYKWMLNEKRKLKPSSPEEKARIDMEKAMLKEYIRGKRPVL